MLASASGPYDDLGFTYDGVGNRLTRSVDDGSVETDTYSYPTTNNRLASIDQNGSFTRTMTYDNAGNTLVDTRADGVFTYTYNAANRMDSVTETGSITVYSEYVYNAQGQQVIRTLYGGATPVEIHSVHDLDGNRIAEYEYDSATSTSMLLREYIWLQGSPIAVIENGTIHYIRTDHIGRPVFATDATGTQVWQATYLPFGGVHTSTGANSDLRFPGQWFQSETALHQNWMRDYDPTTGKYIQADPLGLVDGASVYGYARGNPGRHADPRGQFTAGDAITLMESRGEKPGRPNRWDQGWTTEQLFNAWSELEEAADKDWQEELLPCPCPCPCPCNLWQVGEGWTAPTEADQYYHPDGVTAIRQKHSTPDGHGNQCVYDAQGQLITSGTAAGSADFRAPDGVNIFKTVPHFNHDVAPYNWARELDKRGGGSKYVERYFSVRPVVAECCEQ